MKSLKNLPEFLFTQSDKTFYTIPPSKVKKIYLNKIQKSFPSERFGLNSLDIKQFIIFKNCRKSLRILTFFFNQTLILWLTKTFVDIFHWKFNSIFKKKNLNKLSLRSMMQIFCFESFVINIL